MSKAKPINVPFVIITLSTILGIILAKYIVISLLETLFVFCTALALLIIAWKQAKKIFTKPYYFTIFTMFFFILFGVSLVVIYHPKNKAVHYTNKIEPNILLSSKKGIRFTIKERLKSTSHYHKYIVALDLIDSTAVSGNLLLKTSLTSKNPLFTVGDSYTSYTKIRPVTKPLNPNQFDYAAYLSNQYIYHQVTIPQNGLIKNPGYPWSIYRVADLLRQNINTKLSKHLFDQEQTSIINALLLGQRQDMSNTVLNQYRDAGALHILAVSGLHVGILFLIINFIVRPLRSSKNGKIIAIIVVLMVLWCFAIIAGLSPSILRAVTMFSFVAIGKLMRSEINIYNSLFISMFILLCFDPLLVFSVGFQLSYLAVFSIAWIQPILVSKYRPKFFITKKLWETFTVTIAAQIGILPVSIWYFHQFPLLFFVSNMLIIPFLGIILGFGILVIILAATETLPKNISHLFAECIDTMNFLIGWVAKQDAFVIKNISMSFSSFIFCYGFIISLIIMIKKYSIQKLSYVMGFLTLLIAITTLEHNQASKKKEFIVYHQSHNTIIGILKNQKLNLYSKKAISKKSSHFLFGNYLVKNKADITSVSNDFKKTYQYKAYAILVIDSSNFEVPHGNTDIIILSHSPKIHLERVLDSLAPRQIVADGSNYKSYINRWAKTCKTKKIPFYRTDKKGAFILK